MADTLVLGANVFDVWVQVPPPAPKQKDTPCGCLSVLIGYEWDLKPKRAPSGKKTIDNRFPRRWCETGTEMRSIAVVEYGIRAKHGFVPPPAPKQKDTPCGCLSVLMGYEWDLKPKRAPSGKKAP